MTAAKQPVNPVVVQLLEEIGAMMELLGEDSFRASAHTRAARTIRDLAVDISTLGQGDELKAKLVGFDGVGPKIADKIVEFVATGEIAEHGRLAAKVPGTLLELLQVPGLGPKTIRSMWQEAGVVDKASLKKIIDDGTILKLPRMGAKSVEKIKASLSFSEALQQRLWLGVALPIAEAIVARLAPGAAEITYAGSLRRGKETIGDLDILATVAKDDAKAAGRLMETFRTLPGVQEVLAAGENKSSVRLAASAELCAIGDERKGRDVSLGPGVQVDLRVVPAASWGAALMYFTGSKEHNVALRERSLKRGMTLNEYGLFPEDDEKTPPQARGVRPVASRTEEEIYRALGLAFIPPELREDRGEIERYALPGAASGEDEKSGSASAKGKVVAATKSQGRSKAAAGDPGLKPGEGPLPARRGAAAPEVTVAGAAGSRRGVSAGTGATGPARLIEIGDIKSELHAHTTASDGVMTILELANAAKARGFHTVAVTDHSKSSPIAGGLTVERLKEHINAVREANDRIEGITILAGSEVDILADGRLDYDDDLLAQLDIVVASPHTATTQDPETATKRLLRAIRHPLLHVLGHPTGRLINRRPGLSPDIAELAAAAAEHGVALEINAHWMRLDLRDTHVRAAVDAGCLIAINCDTHTPGDMDNLRYGVLTGRRGGVTAERCVNAWGAAELHGWLKRKRSR